MKLGVSTSVYLHNNLKEAIKKIANLNFEYIELWGEPPHLWFENIDYKYLKDIKKELQKRDLKATFHAPAHDVDLTSMNPGIRKESIKQHIKAIEIASFLEANLMVVHTGSYYPGDKKGSENGKNRLYKSLNKILPYAEQHDIIIALENYPVGENAIFNSPENVKKILGDFNSKFLKITLDIGHANLTKISAVEYLNKLKEEIVHLHINDNFGQADEHLIPGKGNIDYKKLLQTIKEINYDKIGIFELWSPENTDQALIDSTKYVKNI
ncbi:MAG TPA: sugar phosphate isomerase/epimerase [Halanaerobiales bacterium]|nr:sugar phosphate isomerase/epimerase [Halanaerobiales bacterium]